jgi:membrane protein YqaA with SNARE-associated domain
MELADQLIYLGIPGMFLAGLLAGTVVPFSSEIVLVALLAVGLDPTALLIAGTIGNWIGGMTTYWIGWLGKTEWLEKYFGVSHQKLLNFEARLKKWGAYWAILSWVPIAGNIITAALGFFKAPKYGVAFWMFVGKVGRYAVLILSYNYWATG